MVIANDCSAKIKVTHTNTVYKFFMQPIQHPVLGLFEEGIDISALGRLMVFLAYVLQNPDRTNVGKVFTDHIPQMVEVYKAYCLNHDDAAATLEKLEKEPDFQLPLQECLNNVKCVASVMYLGSNA